MAAPVSLRRPCLGPVDGLPCPDDVFVVSGRCPACTAARERSRGSTTERGYGAEHQRARDELRQQLPEFCGYGCGTWLDVDDRWVAAHVEDGNPGAGYLISCPPCNERHKRRA